MDSLIKSVSGVAGVVGSVGNSDFLKIVLGGAEAVAKIIAKL